MGTMINALSKILLLLLFMVPSVAGELYGQQNDFQSWFEAEVAKGLKNGIDLSGEFEQRFRNNSTQFDRTLFTVAASYDPYDYLSTGGGVRLLFASDRETNISPGYRIHGDATGKYSLGEVDFSLRFRLQYGFEEFLYITRVQDNTFVNRNRLKGSYHIFGTRFEIFAYMETWGLFRNQNGRFFKRMRYTAGASYSLNLQSQLSLRYMIEDEFNQVNPVNNYILVLGYSYKL